MIEIVPFRTSLREAFYRLNAEWLTRYFALEEIDHRVLSQPETEILQPGGKIFFALLNDEPVGCCALMPDGVGGFELTKMAVTPHCQGLGIGKRLLEAAIAAFERSGAQQLFLESNSKLTTALHLYQSMGFVRQPAPRPGSHYVRADVYMIYQPEASVRSAPLSGAQS